MRALIRGRRFRQRTRFIGGVVGFIASEQAPAAGASAGVPSGTGAAVGVSFAAHLSAASGPARSTKNNRETSDKQPENKPKTTDRHGQPPRPERNRIRAATPTGSGRQRLRPSAVGGGVHRQQGTGPTYARAHFTGQKRQRPRGFEFPENPHERKNYGACGKFALWGLDTPPPPLKKHPGGG